MDQSSIQEMVMGILGIGIAYFSLFIIYRFIRMKNQERKALIEKNMDPSLASFFLRSGPSDLRKTGWIFLSISIGIILGYFLHMKLSLPPFVAYPVMILLLCGCVLIYLDKSEKEA